MSTNNVYGHTYQVFCDGDNCQASVATSGTRTGARQKAIDAGWRFPVMGNNPSNYRMLDICPACWGSNTVCSGLAMPALDGGVAQNASR